jgi:hypothetical protein
MQRATRVEYPGAIYHVMDRGDRREDILMFAVAQASLDKPVPPHHCALIPP